MTDSTATVSPLQDDEHQQRRRQTGSETSRFQFSGSRQVHQKPRRSVLARTTSVTSVCVSTTEQSGMTARQFERQATAVENKPRTTPSGLSGARGGGNCLKAATNIPRRISHHGVPGLDEHAGKPQHQHRLGRKGTQRPPQVVPHQLGLLSVGPLGALGLPLRSRKHGSLHAQGFISKFFAPHTTRRLYPTKAQMRSYSPGR